MTANEIKRLSEFSAKPSHEASLVERIEKLAYGHIDDEPLIRPTQRAKRPRTLTPR